MRMLSRSLVIILLFFVSTAAFQPPPSQSPSLSRGDDGTLTPEKAGRIFRGNYLNEFFGFEVKPIAGWDLLSRGQMNVSEAFGREAMGMKLGIHNKARVFGMHDGMGTNTFMAIVPLPPDATDAAMRDQKLVEVAKRDLPDAQITKETVYLTDGSHTFTGFRIQYALQGQTFFQSLQSTELKGHLLAFTTTASSAQKLSATLADLKKAITWK